LANHKSAAKRARQAVRRKTRNSKVEATVRTFEKRLRKALEVKDSKTAPELLRTFASQVDKAAQKGIVHFKAASRKISRLSAQVAALTK
jgi:small subunit ribosomal protein S20